MFQFGNGTLGGSAAFMPHQREKAENLGIIQAGSIVNGEAA
jgi:hypothetical protein